MFYKSVVVNVFCFVDEYRPIGDESGLMWSVSPLRRVDRLSSPMLLCSLHTVVMATKYANVKSSSFIPSRKFLYIF